MQQNATKRCVFVSAAILRNALEASEEARRRPATDVNIDL